MKKCILCVVFILFIILLKMKIKLNENFENNNYNEWFNNNVELYYINLDKSKDRNKKMIKQLNNLGINYNRFNAYNGKNINENKLNNNRLFQDFDIINYEGSIYNKKKGSLGNYISQLTCWYNFYLNSKKPYIMVMEDDIIIDKKFNSKIVYEYLKLLEKEDWKMLKFFCFNKRIGPEFKNKLVKATCNKINFRATQNTGMQCYIVNKKYIKKIISELLPINNETFDWKIKYIMMNNDIYITKKDYVSTPEHDTYSDRKSIDRN